jgi:hypothetical protein
MKYVLYFVGLERDGPTFPIQADAPPSTALLPVTPEIMPHFFSNEFILFEAPDLCLPPGPPITPFDMDKPSPSQSTSSPLPEPINSQGHCETASDTSTFSLTPPNSDLAPSSPSTTSIDEVLEFQTKEELRAHLDQHIRSAQWFRHGELEPTVGAPGVPTWAVQLAPRSRSIYECFVKTARERGLTIYKCSSHGCKFKSTRLRRVVGHQRKKRNHKPFACETHTGWYVLAAAMSTNNID